MNKNTTTFSIAAVWLIAILLALISQKEAGLRDFDPTSKLYAISLSDNQFDSLLNEISNQGNDDNIVVHIRNKDCVCNSIASQHIKNVASLAETQNMTYKTLYIEDQPSLREWVPSVPAIAIINESGKLTYFGAYSSGIKCSPNEGFPEKYINGYENQFGTDFSFEAMGCYCNISKI